VPEACWRHLRAAQLVRVVIPSKQEQWPIEASAIIHLPVEQRTQGLIAIQQTDSGPIAGEEAVVCRNAAHEEQRAVWRSRQRLQELFTYRARKVIAAK
jgi:hypothetical protein